MRILTIDDATVRPGDLFRDLRANSYDRVLRVEEISGNAAYAEVIGNLRSRYGRAGSGLGGRGEFGSGATASRKCRAGGRLPG